MCQVIEVGQRITPDTERHSLALSRLKKYLGKAFEFFFWPLESCLLVLDVHLHHFLARTLSRIGDIDRHLQGVSRVHLRGAQPQGAIDEGRIGEAKAEREQRRDLFCIVVAIADEESLSVIDLAIFSRKIEVGRIVREACREGLGLWCDRVVCIDLSAAPTHDLCHFGVGANHGNRGEVLGIAHIS